MDKIAKKCKCATETLGPASDLEGRVAVLRDRPVEQKLAPIDICVDAGVCFVGVGKQAKGVWVQGWQA